ncbi:MAG: prepilin peptidase [Actinobacteria bacterium]|nr:prepilin peptidase [Actinomycetota bacterium]
MHNLLPLLVLAGFGLWLSAVDLKVHRLPNYLVAWFAVTQVVTLIGLSLGDLERLKVPILVATGSLAIYSILLVLSRGALGMGDVKFAFPLGLTVGWFAPDLWLIAIFTSFLLAGIVAVIGLVAKRIERTSHIAFGPYMFLGSFVVIAYSVLSL